MFYTDEQILYYWDRYLPPKGYKRLFMDRVFTDIEYAMLKVEIIPREIEDRWWIVYRDDWLLFFNGIIRQLCYRVKIEHLENHHIAKEAWAPSKHGGLEFPPQSRREKQIVKQILNTVGQDEESEHDETPYRDRFLDFLIDSMLLKKVVVYDLTNLR